MRLKWASLRSHLQQFELLTFATRSVVAESIFKKLSIIIKKFAVYVFWSTGKNGYFCYCKCKQRAPKTTSKIGVTIYFYFDIHNELSICRVTACSLQKKHRLILHEFYELCTIEMLYNLQCYMFVWIEIQKRCYYFWFFGYYYKCQGYFSISLQNEW